MEKSWKALGLGKATADITYQSTILVHTDRRIAYISGGQLLPTPGLHNCLKIKLTCFNPSQNQQHWSIYTVNNQMGFLQYLG